MSTRNALLAGISTTLRAGNGTAPSPFGSGPDISATAQMTIALAATRQYPATVRTAVRALKANAADYTGAGADASPAALGTLLQVAAVTAEHHAQFVRRREPDQGAAQQHPTLTPFLGGPGA